MRIAFCVPGLSASNVRLQPWLTFYRVGERLASEGHAVSLITDMPVGVEIGGLEVRSVRSLRGTNREEILDVIGSLGPEKLVMPVTPLSIVTQRWVDRLEGCQIFGYLSYAFYTTTELVRAYRYLDARDRWSYSRHLMVPSVVWRHLLVRRFHKLIGQSETTVSRVRRLTGDRIDVECIPPGIDRDVWFRDRQRAGLERAFLYVGTPSDLRGFRVLLRALERVVEPDVRCKVLARGADPNTVGRLKQEVAARALTERVQIVGGWMGVDALRREISNAAAVVLPFVLVPSELPVSVMEALACGTPVIGTAIDGLPSAIGDAGLLARQADARDLARQLDRYSADGALRDALSRRCRVRGAAFPTWEQTARCWVDVLADAQPGT